LDYSFFDGRKSALVLFEVFGLSSMYLSFLLQAPLPTIYLSHSSLLSLTRFIVFPTLLRVITLLTRPVHHDSYPSDAGGVFMRLP